MSTPYVVVRHNKTHEAFVLDRNYSLVCSIAPQYIMHKLLHRAKSSWKGWFPSLPSQSPSWAKRFTSSEFTAFWPRGYDTWTRSHKSLEDLCNEQIHKIVSTI